MTEREPIDLSSISPALHPEVAGGARVEALYTGIVHMVEADGVPATVWGTEITVTEAAISDFVVDDGTEIENGPHLARAYRSEVVDTEGATHTRFGVLFDMHPDPAVVITENPHAVYFDEVLGKTTLFVDTKQIPEANKPEHIELVSKIVDQLSVKIGANRSAKEAEAAEAAAALEAEQAELAMRRAEARRAVGAKVVRFATTPLRFLDRHKVPIIATAGVGAVISAGVYGLMQIEGPSDDPPAGRTAELDGGAVSTLGSEGVAPEFSEELYNNPELDRFGIDTLGTSSTSDDTLLDDDDGLLEVILTSSNEGKNCEVRDVDKAPLDSTILSWTDAVTPAGESRADEFEVIYRTEEVEVCWNGQELDDTDDPRVVVTLRDADGNRYDQAD